jgi:hypothetical protein
MNKSEINPQNSSLMPTKLRWYSEAETMDEEELTRKKALEGVEGPRRIQRP